MLRGLFLLLLPLLAWAGPLRVTVLDPSGAVIAGATVRVAAGGAPHTALTDQRGVAAFLTLPASRATVRVQAAGFAAKEQQVALKGGDNQLEIHLEIATLKDDIAVQEDPRESATDPKGNGMSTALTPKQIENLPDDPEEMQMALEAMAGPGATMRVDGFRGGRLPHKSQIQSIRFRLTPFSAEEHDDGFNMVDITTKAGLGLWHGSMAYAYGGDVLNARNFFSPTLEPQQAKRIDFSATGPLIANRTSLSVAFVKNTGFDSKSTFGVLPSGLFSNLVRLPSEATSGNLRLQQWLPKGHSARLEYQYAEQSRSSLGVSDLPERLNGMNVKQHVMRISDSGMLSEQVLTDLRFQLQWSSTGTSSATAAPAIIVPGAFSAGGSGLNSRRSARQMDLTQGVSFNRGKHNLRAGFQLDGAWYDDRDLTNANGTFLFARLADYMAGRPLQYTRRVGDVPVSYTQYQFGGFLQDDIRVKKTFSLSLGLRYETQTNLPDHLNLSPRVGFAWSPFQNGKTVFRGGVGLYYGWFESSIYEQILRVNGARQSDIVILQPGYPDPATGGTGAATTLPPSIYTRQASLAMPQVLRASLGVQRQFGMLNLMSDVRMQRGTHQLRSQNINAPLHGVRPDPSAGNVMEIGSGANSSLYGWSIGFHPAPGPKGMPRVFWFLNYTLSSATNETDSPLSAPSNSFNLRADRGPAQMDARHRVASFVNMKLGRGYQLGTFVRASSALPYNVTTGFDTNGDSIVNDRPAGMGRNRARGSATFDASVKLSWTRPLGRARTESGTQQMRMMIGGPGAAGVPDLPGANTGLAQLQFYVQAYNVINHANFSNYVGVLTSPLYGQPTSAMAGRRVELGMKVSF